MRVWIGAALVSLSLVAIARSDDAAKDTPKDASKDAPKDDFRWDPRKAWKPAVGARRFEEREVVSKSVEKATAAGADTVAEDAAETVSYRAVFEVLAVSDDGAVTDEKMKLERWSLAPQGEDPDRTLEGKTLRLKGTGKARTWALEDGATVSPTAKSWIDAYFAQPESDERTEACLLPSEPVAAGASWTCDPSAVASALYPGVEIDAKRSSVKGKLGTVSVKNGVHFGRYEVKASLRLTKSPDGIEWKDALQEISISVDGSLERDKTFAEDAKKEWKFTGKGAVRGKDAGDLEEKAQTTIKAKVGALPGKAEK